MISRQAAPGDRPWEYTESHLTKFTKQRGRNATAIDMIYTGGMLSWWKRSQIIQRRSRNVPEYLQSSP